VEQNLSRTWCRILILLAALLSFGRSAFASDVASAEALFQEGRRLMEAGQLEEACAKFNASFDLDASSGTLLNLADCHERTGRIATAWAEFLSAARLARAQQRPARAEEAQRRADVLEPLVCRLTIQTSSPVPGLVVTRSGASVPASALGVPLPVDPGSHEIRAEAPGYEAWSSSVVIEAGTRDTQVTIPELMKAAPAAPAPSGSDGATPAADRPANQATAAPQTGGPRLKAGFWVAAGTAVIAAGTATVFGILSLNSYAEAEARCSTHVSCDATTMQLSDQANTQANVANVAIATAIVATAVGTWFYFKKEPKKAMAAAPRLTWTW